MVRALSLDADNLTTVPTSLNALMLRHCHLDEDTLMPDVHLNTMYMLAAIHWFEGETKRAVVARSHRWVLESFPCEEYGKIRLPAGRIQSIQSIQYINSGSAITLTGPSGSPAGADFQEDLYSDGGGIVMPLQGSSWPATDCDVPAPIVMYFIAGWTADDIPEDALQCLLFYVDDCVELRGTSDLDISGQYLSYRNEMVSKYAIRRVF